MVEKMIINLTHEFTTLVKGKKVIKKLMIDQS
jgi:hypothetical protein